MKLSIKKTVLQDEELDIELPAYFRLQHYVVRVGDDETVVQACKQLIYVKRKGDLFHERDLGEIIQQGAPINKLEFENKFAEYLTGISADACVVEFVHPEMETV